MSNHAGRMHFSLGGDKERMRAALAVTVALLAGCGVPQELPQQAEEVASVAAEAALLAHDAGEGSTTETFTREHSKALQKLLRQVEPAIEHEGLSTIAQTVDLSLTRLAGDPGDEAGARRLEQKLERAADAAGELAG